MKTLEQMHAEERRLHILRCLVYEVGYSANDALIQRALEIYGIKASRDQIRSDLAWLAEQDLARVEVMAGLYLARLSGRGEDVALGRAVVPGVARPRPE